jgi:hypothetical protein
VSANAGPRPPCFCGQPLGAPAHIVLSDDTICCVRCGAYFTGTLIARDDAPGWRPPTGPVDVARRAVGLPLGSPEQARVVMAILHAIAECNHESAGGDCWCSTCGAYRRGAEWQRTGAAGALAGTLTVLQALAKAEVAAESN